MPAAERERPRSVRRLGLALTLLAGGTLATLGVTQTVAALLQIRASNEFAVLRASSPGAAQATVADAKADLQRADSWRSDPANAVETARLYMRFSAPGEGSDTDRELAAEARAELERSLTEAPGNPEAWIWLAAARLIEQGPSQATVDAYDMSIALAPFDPAVLVWRCQTGLALYPVLDQDQKDDLDEQIQMLEEVSTDDLVRVARASQRIDVVVHALSADKAALTRFGYRIRVMK